MVGFMVGEVGTLLLLGLLVEGKADGLNVGSDEGFDEGREEGF